MSKSRVMVEYAIYGDEFSPDDITHLLGIKPTEKRVKGLIPEGGWRPSIETSWGLATKKEESYDVNNQLDQIILQLKDKIDILKKIRREYKIKMVFAVLIEVENNEIPAVHFETTTLKFITDIGAEIDIDIYVYS